MMFQMADDFSPYSTGNDKDKDLDGIIRPHELTDFTGQDKIVTNLKIFIKAAKMRGEPSYVCMQGHALLPQVPEGRESSPPGYSRR